MSDQSRRHPTDVVRSFIQAYQADRLEDVLALISPVLVWLPLSRPGRSRYVGHDGFRHMLADVTAAWGERPRFELPDIEELADDTVIARGWVSVPEKTAIQIVFKLRDGLIVMADVDEPLDG